MYTCIYIDRIGPTKKGKTYLSIWLRESYRVGNKTYKRSYANLKDWPDELVAKLEEYLNNQKPSRKHGETPSKNKKAVQEQVCRPKDIERKFFSSENVRGTRSERCMSCTK